MRISDWSSDVCSSDLAGGIERRSGWNRIIAGSVGRATVEAGAEIRLNPESRLLLASGNLFVDGSIEVRSGSIRSEEHTSELQSLMRISYAVFCLKKKKQQLQNKQLYPELIHSD